MTNRVSALTVILKDDVREDEIEHLKNALLMIKGVSAVEPIMSDPLAFVAHFRIKQELVQKLFEVLQ